LFNFFSPGKTILPESVRFAAGTLPRPALQVAAVLLCFMLHVISGSCYPVIFLQTKIN
jgi:hypothetical protein